MDFVNFDNICHVILKKNLFLSEVKPLTIITKHFILDVAAALDPPLSNTQVLYNFWSALLRIKSMQVELLGLLQHVGCFMRLFKR